MSLAESPLAASRPLTVERSAATLPEGGRQPTVLWLRGEYDLATRDELAAAMAAAIAADDADLVLDLSEVAFMDGLTLGEIIRAREAAMVGSSRSVSVRAPSSAAQRILGACDLADLLDPKRVPAARSS